MFFEPTPIIGKIGVTPPHRPFLATVLFREYDSNMIAQVKNKVKDFVITLEIRGKKHYHIVEV
jgi:hypothetical protein